MENIITKKVVSENVSGIERWILVITALSCALLEIIDTTVVNVSLREMMGSLGATSLEISWVVTAYSIGNVITIPLSAMLSELFGRKIYFTGSVIIFTIASLMCGLSNSLWVLIGWRFIQGLGGGGLLTTAQSIITDAFPPGKLATATAIFGVGIMVGPAVGPVLGGYITDNWSWNWVFFINIPIGIMAAMLSWKYIPNLLGAKRPKKLDWYGIIFLIIGLCSLQYFLETGENKDWFESSELTFVFILAILGILAFIIRELSVKEPAVNIRLYKNFNLAVGALLNLVLGFILVGIFFIFPLFVQSTLGWTATQQGAFLIPSTIASAFAMILVSKIVLRFLNYNLAGIIGIVMLSAFAMLLSFASPDSNYNSFFWPFMFFAFGKALLMVPLMSMALAGLRGKQLAQATGLSNIVRTLGGAIGVALLGIYVNHENAYVRNNIIGNISEFNNVATERITAYSQNFMQMGYSQDDATNLAYKILDAGITKQYQIISYNNTYMAVAVMLLIAIPLILLFKNNSTATSNSTEDITIH